MRSGANSCSGFFPQPIGPLTSIRCSKPRSHTPPRTELNSPPLRHRASASARNGTALPRRAHVRRAGDTAYPTYAPHDLSLTSDRPRALPSAGHRTGAPGVPAAPPRWHHGGCRRSPVCSMTRIGHIRLTEEATP
jgi:hypothetical protein